MKVAFVSKNENKIREVNELLADVHVQIMSLKHSIEELQTQDEKKLVKDKLIKAFKYCGIPVLVEHTSLQISYLNGFPGGLTEIFWEKLKHQKFAEVFGKLSDNTLIAKTTIGYCDGKSVFFFEGQVNGSVPHSPRGSLDFQWDSVFVPDGYSQTFAEMGPEIKNKISMRRIAYDKFIKHIKKHARTS